MKSRRVARVEKTIAEGTPARKPRKKKKVSIESIEPNNDIFIIDEKYQPTNDIMQDLARLTESDFVSIYC